MKFATPLVDAASNGPDRSHPLLITNLWNWCCKCSKFSCFSVFSFLIKENIRKFYCFLPNQWTISNWRCLLFTLLSRMIMKLISILMHCSLAFPAIFLRSSRLFSCEIQRHSFMAIHQHKLCRVILHNFTTIHLFPFNSIEFNKIRLYWR